MNRSSQLEGEANRAIWASRMLPYLLAILCCLMVLREKPSDIPPLSVLVWTIGMVLLAVGVVHGIFWVVIRKSPARELLLAQLVSFVGFYGDFSGLLIAVWGGLVFLTVCVVWNACLAERLYRFDNHRVTQALTQIGLYGVTIALFFRVIDIGTPVFKDTRQLDNLLSELSDADSLSGQQVSISKNELPDIYYVIVDAYAREDVLQQTYGFDNRPFTDSLRTRGFYVGDESRSNYHLTELSLASSLNMTHLHELDLQRFQTRMPIREMIKGSRVARFLKQQGYETLAFETGKSDTQCDNFDRYISFGYAFNDYQDVLYFRSLMPKLFDWTGIPFLSAAGRHGSRTIETLEAIPTSVRPDAKPTFVFSHMLAPHPPFVFDANGKDVDLHGFYLLADGSHFTACHDYDTEVYRKAYSEQVAFINQKLIEMVDQIQSSDRPAIIIIQADHGPRMGFGSLASPDAVDGAVAIREALSILNAIYLPAKWKPDFYASMTPVNTFRLIFNEVFGSKLSLEADESYLETDYEFRNVTRDAMPPDETLADSINPESGKPHRVTSVVPASISIGTN